MKSKKAIEFLKEFKKIDFEAEFERGKREFVIENMKYFYRGIQSALEQEAA